MMTYIPQDPRFIRASEPRKYAEAQPKVIEVVEALRKARFALESLASSYSLASAHDEVMQLNGWARNLCSLAGEINSDYFDSKWWHKTHGEYL